MAVGTGGNARKGSVRKRLRAAAKMTRKKHSTKRARTTDQSASDTLRTEIAVLETEITATEQKLSAARDEARREHNRLLLDLLATEQRLLKNRTKRLALAFQRAEPALDEAILALGRVVLAAHNSSAS